MDPILRTPQQACRNVEEVVSFFPPSPPQEKAHCQEVENVDLQIKIEELRRRVLQLEPIKVECDHLKIQIAALQNQIDKTRQERDVYKSQVIELQDHLRKIQKYPHHQMTAAATRSRLLSQSIAAMNASQQQQLMMAKNAVAENHIQQRNPPFPNLMEMNVATEERWTKLMAQISHWQLPEYGELVKTMIQTGPLLRDYLLCGGTMPHWNHPPFPDLNFLGLPIIAANPINSFHTPGFGLIIPKANNDAATGIFEIADSSGAKPQPGPSSSSAPHHRFLPYKDNNNQVSFSPVFTSTASAPTPSFYFAKKLGRGSTSRQSVQFSRVQ